MGSAGGDPLGAHDVFEPGFRQVAGNVLLGFAVHDAQGNQVIDVAEHLPGFILGTGACRKVGESLGGNEQVFFLRRTG